MKKNKGITLIALVITIVILIILAGVSINILLGENGLITKANQAALVEKDKQVETEIKLAINSYTIDKVKNPNVDLKQVLKQELEEQYLGKVIETEKNIIIEYKDKEYKIEIETGKIEENSNYDLWDGKSISIGLVGEGTEEKPYLIRSANDLAYMNEQTSTAISFITPDIIGLEEDGITPNGHNMCANDANYKLMCNIALNDISEFDKWDTPEFDKSKLNVWYPIGKNKNTQSYVVEFNGNFDGNGYEIAGMYYENNDAYYVGFFCNLNYSNIVKDLIINKCYIIGNCNVGGITGNIQENTKISNCYVSGIIKCEQSDFIGGIVGQAQSNVTIEKCVNEAIVDGKYDVGGIVGLATTNVKVINCKNYGEIKSFVNASVSRNYIGGIVGEGYGNVALHDCYNYGDINCKEDVYWYYIGGIAGSLSNMSSIEKCYNYGSIPRRENTNNNGKYCAQIGGIVGILNKSNIKNVYNYSNIYIRNPESYGEAIAGIVGYCSITEQMQIENVYNYGNIDCNTESSAGLFGKITEYGIENAKLTLINCRNEGNVANGKEITGSVKNTIEVITK